MSTVEKVDGIAHIPLDLIKDGWLLQILINSRRIKFPNKNSSED